MVKVKKFFLMFKGNFLDFNLCPLPLVLFLGAKEKNLPLSSLLPPSEFIHVGKIPLGRFFPPQAEHPVSHLWNKQVPFNQIQQNGKHLLQLGIRSAKCSLTCLQNRRYQKSRFKLKCRWDHVYQV